mmetsp:Transcript_119259/g.337350  ORF Transcript_119259/g.337350 Transcript_119259/m.337350 type:complete len:246 (-) Transcript_119259:73-810(-)
MVTVGPHRLTDDEVEGAIFDVDGTLLDTMPLFYHAWPKTGALPQFGLTCTEDDFYGTAGLPLPDIVQTLHVAQRGEPATEEFVKDFLAEKLRLSREDEAVMGHPAAIPGVIELAKGYKERGIPIAIATSGNKDIVLSHLHHAGIHDLFDEAHMVFATDVPRGKPDPAIYLEAARRLGVDPARCRAYEDAEMGLKSAYAAGMETIDVTYMEGYPCPDALRKAKDEQTAKRSWLPKNGADALASNGS